MVTNCKAFFFLFLFLTYPNYAKLQQNPGIFETIQQPSATGGSLKIVQTEPVKNAFIAHLEAQKANQLPTGYRIVIFSDAGQQARKNAEETRSHFLARYETIKCTTIFRNRFFWVLVGNFRTRSEAVRNLKMIERDFPGAYIVDEVIDNP